MDGKISKSIFKFITQDKDKPNKVLKFIELYLKFNSSRINRLI